MWKAGGDGWCGVVLSNCRAGLRFAVDGAAADRPPRTADTTDRGRACVLGCMCGAPRGGQGRALLRTADAEAESAGLNLD